MEINGKYQHIELEKLLFRRQFILGPYFIDKFPSWNKIIVDKSICLTVHPELEVCHAAHENKSLILLGYILDPNNPEADNAAIINNLIELLDTATDFFELTYELGGRWALIVNDGERIIIFNDAAGLRQAFYIDSSRSTEFWCASQPSLISEIMKLKTDDDAHEFITFCKQNNIEQHWWPGDTSPYKLIKCMLPNHFLDLSTGRVHRYWPASNIEKVSLEEAVVKSSKLLSGMIRSAHNRFRLALPLTAGWDSRLCLAAARDIADQIFYFTSIFWYVTQENPDVIVPVTLLSQLGLGHEIIDYTDQVNIQFSKIYHRNVSTAHDIYCHYAQAIYDKYPSNRVSMKGDVSEVAKCYYRLPESNGQKITGLILASLSEGMPIHSFATKAFDRWLSNIIDPYDIHILDLFCWEQDVGRCVALIQAECDIVHESFSPFNCRALLATMLSVDEKYRKVREPYLYEKLIKKLWPELLSVPVNPSEKKSMDDIIRKILKKTKFYQFVPKPIKKIGKNFLSLLQ